LCFINPTPPAIFLTRRDATLLSVAQVRHANQLLDYHLVLVLPGYDIYSNTDCIFNLLLLPPSSLSSLFSTLSARRLVASPLTLLSKCSGLPSGAGPVRIGGRCKPSRRAGRLLSLRRGSDVMEGLRAYGDGYAVGSAGK
jgi:hypothetical protein